MQDKTLRIKTILFLAGGTLLTIGVGIKVYNLMVEKIKEIPLPSFGIIIQAVVVILVGFAILYALDKIAEKVKKTFDVEIVKRVVLTLMLISTVYFPLYYGFFWWLPSLLGPKFPFFDKRWLLLIHASLFFVSVGSFYCLISQIWPDIGKIKWGLLFSSMIIVTFLIISLWQIPYKLFNRDGTSDVMYNPNDFKPYFCLKSKPNEKIYDERDGEALVQLAKDIEKEKLIKIQQRIPRIQEVVMFWKWGKPKDPNNDPPQITPQVSYGWRIDRKGNLVANLQSGEEVTRPFRLGDNQSSPWFIIPMSSYRFRLTHLQSVVLEAGNQKTIVHPDEYFDMGIINGEQKFRITALKGGANITLHIRRL